MAGRDLPSLSALRAFEAAARHLSFRAAAEELGLTQSAISPPGRGAGDEHFGARLFDRAGRRIALSEAGPPATSPSCATASTASTQGTDLLRRAAHDRRSARPGLCHGRGALADPAPAPLPEPPTPTSWCASTPATSTGSSTRTSPISASICTPSPDRAGLHYDHAVRRAAVPGLHARPWRKAASACASRSTW